MAAPARAAAIAAGALLALLTVGSMRAFLSGIYYHNLTALGLNSTALYALLLLAPIVYLLPVLRRAGLVATAAAAALAAARGLLPALAGTTAHLAVAGVAAGAALVALPALARLAHERGGPHQGPLDLAIGLSLGLALDAGLALLFRSQDLLVQGLPGIVGSILVGTALVLAVRRLDMTGPHARGRSGGAAAGRGRRGAGIVEPKSGALALASVGLGAWLFLQHVAFASPYALARWNGFAPRAAAVSVVVGLLLPLALTLRAAALPRGSLLVLNVLGALAVLDHVFLHSPALLALLPFAQVALALDVALLLAWLGAARLPRPGRAFVAGSLVLLALHFALAFSFTFAFVPLGALWQGAERWLLPLAFLLVALPVARELPRALHVPALPTRAVALALAAPLLLLGGGLFAPQAPIAPAPDEQPLAVMSFNVHQGFDNRGVTNLEAFERVLVETRPDIVSLQESDTARFTSANVDVVSHLAERLGYHSAYGPPTREQSVGLSLLSRHPILEWSVHQLPSETDNRFFLEAQLDVRGRAVWVYAVHFGLEQPDREAQVAALLARAATREGPTMLVGDFNSCPSGRCPRYEGAADQVYEQVAARYADAWVAAGHGAADAEGYTYDAFAPFERIDYVFVSEEFEVLKAAPVSSEAALAASDHLPVLARVRLPPAASA